MNPFYQWCSCCCRPPRWMAFAYYSVMRNQVLFVIPPVNLLIALAWWVQDKWAMHAQATSWIEEETRRRMERYRKNEIGYYE